MLRNHLASSSLFQPGKKSSLVSRPLLGLVIPRPFPGLSLSVHDKVSEKHSGTVITKSLSPIYRVHVSLSSQNTDHDYVSRRGRGEIEMGERSSASPLRILS